MNRYDGVDDEFVLLNDSSDVEAFIQEFLGEHGLQDSVGLREGIKYYMYHFPGPLNKPRQKLKDFIYGELVKAWQAHQNRKNSPYMGPL